MSRPVNSQIKRSTNAIPRWPFTINRQSEQAGGLVAWWPCDPNQGSTIIDLVSRNDGAVSGTATFGSSAIGQTIVQTGASGQGVSAPTAAAALLTTPVTAALWVYPYAAQTPELNGLLTKAQSSPYPFTFRYQAPASAGIQIYNDGAGALSTSFLPTVGEWTHLVVVVTNAFRGIYANGVLIASDGGSSIGTNSDPLIFGNDNGLSARAFNGQYRDVRIYSRALSAAEVWALYDPATRYELFQPVRRFAGKAASAPVGSRRGDFNISLGAV